MEAQRLAPMKTYEKVLGFVYLPFFILLTQVIVGTVLALLGYDLETQDTLVRLNLWNDLVNLVAVGLIFFRFYTHQPQRLFARPGRTIGTIFLGYAMILGGNMLSSLLTTLLESAGIVTSNANQAAAEDIISGAPLAALVMVVISAPIVEETLVRGLVFGLLHRKSRFWAYAVSMFLFSSLHVYQPLLGGEPLVSVLVSFVTYLPMGFALAWVYERCRNLWASIALHMLNNGVAFLAVLAMSMQLPV